MYPDPNELLAVSQAEGEGESWLISYLDLLTLILTLFVLLLSFSTMKTPADSATESTQTPRPGVASLATDILPASSGLVPQQERFTQSLKSLDLKGVEATPGVEGVTLRIDDRLLFTSGSAELTENGESILKKLQPLLADFDGEISVEGHTDSLPIRTARFPSNWELSTGRAIAVLRYLVAIGHPDSKLRAVGYADTRPLAANDSVSGRAENRRVELILREPTED